MSREVRISLHTAIVLRQMLAAPTADHYGFALSKATGLPSGTMYPLLARLEAAGWLASFREPADAPREGRPPRRYYRFTGLGETAAREGVEQVRAMLESVARSASSG